MCRKYLKALLVYHDQDFPYTHDIDKLINLCMEVETFDEDINSASELTVYGNATRYTGDIEDLTKEEALRMVALAEMIEHFVKNKLKEYDLE